MKVIRRRVPTTITAKSMTQQNFKKETDVNSILERYRQTGQINHVRSGSPSYGDFTQVGDYHESINRVIYAQEQFMALPAVVRKRFGNDPAALVEFLSNEKNYEEALQLGLLSPEAVAAHKTTTNKTTTKNESAQPSTGDAPKPENGAAGGNA